MLETHFERLVLKCGLLDVAVVRLLGKVKYGTPSQISTTLKMKQLSKHSIQRERKCNFLYNLHCARV